MDARIRLRGVVGTTFDWAGALASYQLHVSRMEDITLVAPGVADPFALPVTPVTELFRTGGAQAWGHRLHVRGTVMLQRPGTLFLRDETGAVLVESSQLLPTRPGDLLDVVGFPRPDGFAPVLEDASFRILSRNPPPGPLQATASDLLSGRRNAHLVHIEGSVIDVVRAAPRVTILVDASGSIISAGLASDTTSPLLGALETGSRVRLTGVVGPSSAQRLLLRSAADIRLIAPAPFWNPSRTRFVLLLILLLVGGAIGWALLLRKRVRAQTLTIDQRLVERNALIAELEAKNAELERFTYTVSHDLKTPLVTIGGFLGLLEQDALSGNTQRLRADLRRIGEATEKMRRLLEELLRLSRAGRQISTVEALSLDTLVAEARSLLDLTTRNAQIVVEPGLPRVVGDRGRLVEVFQNLLENALKYSGNRDEPTIVIGSEGLDESGRVRIFVRDDGIGIPAEFHSRVFDLFEKLDPASPGTGVGLALVRRIVEAHGGSVTVRSEGKGQGTTFVLSLRAVAGFGK
jgi:signal transduction histidine kinase